MKLKKLTPHLNSIFLIIGVIAVLWSLQNTDVLISFAKAHPVLAPFLIVLWRILGVIIPPIPGGLVSLALIPVFGWFWSYVYATLGLLTGCSIAFLLARKYGQDLVKEFVPLKKIQVWESKLGKNTKFLAFLIIRFTTGPVMDFISYIAGLTKISFRQFFIATFIALLPDAIYYYIGETVYSQTSNSLVTIIFLCIVVYYFSKKYQFVHKMKRLKSRY